MPGIHVGKVNKPFVLTARIVLPARTEARSYVGAEVVATVLAPGVHRRGEVHERADMMETARAQGAR
jgi:hypothetical protein